MKVQDVMTKNVLTCQPETNLAEAAMQMWKGDCGILPVVMDGGKVVGMITDRDLCMAAATKHRDPANIRVKEVTSGKLYGCSPDTDIHEALKIMREKQVRRLPILDAKTKRLVGILSMNDVALKAQAGARAELSADDVEGTLKGICTHPTSRIPAALASAAGQQESSREPKVMKSHPPGVFETTLQKTNLWVKQIGDLLHWDDHQKAYHGLRAVLHAFRDRLPVAEAAHFAAQLPMLVRGFYYEDWKPASPPVKFKTAQEFYDAVKENFAADQNVNPMRLTQAVLQVLAKNLSPGELEKLRAIFPPHLRQIWIESEQTVDLSDYV